MNSRRSLGASLLLTVLALLIGLRPAAGEGQEPSPAPKYEDWRLVAESDLILRAHLTVPVEAIRASVAAENYAYLTLRAWIVEVLKGKPNATAVEVRYFTRPNSYSPSPQAVIDLNQKEALVFLLRSDDPAVAGLYFAGHTPRALQVIEPDVLKAVREEVQNQQRIIATYPRSKAAQPDAQHQKVRALVQQMLDKRTEEAAFEKLEQMGPVAIPSMIRLMNDRRPVPIQSISLVNKSPDAFEGIRHYGPKVVVDAMAALLEQMTGEHFGIIVNGGSERERAATVHGWRVYLHYQLGRSP
jgi:hypothetical protein